MNGGVTLYYVRMYVCAACQGINGNERGFYGCESDLKNVSNPPPSLWCFSELKLFVSHEDDDGERRRRHTVHYISCTCVCVCL